MGRSVDTKTHIGRLVETITQIGKIGWYNIIYWRDRLIQYHILERSVDTITYIGKIGWYINKLTESKLSTFVTQKYDQLLFRIFCKEALICIYIDLVRIVSNLFLMLQKYRPHTHCQSRRRPPDTPNVCWNTASRYLW